MRIICDFDGTITPQDTTDRVLEALADPAWRDLEAKWVAAEITASDCMRQQIALIRGGQDELDAVLDGAALDPGFLEFVCWAERRGLPVGVVSDGVDYFISRILARHGLAHLPVVANRLAGGPGAWRLEQPWTRKGCAAGSGVCKCDVTGPWGGDGPTTIYVGDGRSDFCVSGRADLLFAKGALADYAAARGQAFVPFETFRDVTHALARLTGDLPAGLERAVSL
ncbi:MAG: phosphoserine phosphatase [Phenylobacterium sp.]|nr:phosphoserine phosphatase [Phenylobacterium sp.]